MSKVLKKFYNLIMNFKFSLKLNSFSLFVIMVLFNNKVKLIISCWNKSLPYILLIKHLSLLLALRSRKLSIIHKTKEKIFFNFFFIIIAYKLL